MKYLIIVVIIGIIFFIFKNKIKNKIINSKNKKVELVPVDKDFIFVPILGTRTFELTIEIVELGGGRASINVVKRKVVKPLENMA